MDSDVEQLVRGALVSEPRWIEAAERLRPHLPDHSDDALATIVAAFEYDNINPEQEERRARWGRFGPLFESAEGIYSALLARIEDETLAM